MSGCVALEDNLLGHFFFLSGGGDLIQKRRTSVVDNGRLSTPLVLTRTSLRHIYTRVNPPSRSLGRGGAMMFL